MKVEHMGNVALWLGDCVEAMRAMEAASVDSIVCDPPYELGFMGKAWDATGIAYSAEMWREALRVLKPGGHLLAFSGSRTYHRMACAIEDAGFEIRDQIMWVYGSGFPKSLDVSKAIDKARDDRADGLAVGAWLKTQRELRGFKQKEVAALWPSASGGLTGCVANWEALGKVPKWDQWEQLKAFIGFGDEMDAEVWRLNGRKGTPGNEREDREVSAPAANDVFQPTQRVINAGTPVLEAARQWQGWGTALKPAHEPIVMARKPLAGTVAANVLAHGTGGLNIDACRVHSHDSQGYAYTVQRMAPGADQNKTGKTHQQGVEFEGATKDGRWPANFIHDGSRDVLAGFPDSDGSGPARTLNRGDRADGWGMGREPGALRDAGNGSAARFFYCAKASREDRNEGLPSSATPAVSAGATMGDRETADWQALNGNFHPTVKPTDLMRWLVRLVTPAGGTVLDPFMGSGSTGKAARLESMKFIGVEMQPEYFDIARRRIEQASRQGQLFDQLQPDGLGLEAA